MPLLLSKGLGAATKFILTLSSSRKQAALQALKCLPMRKKRGETEKGGENLGEKGQIPSEKRWRFTSWLRKVKTQARVQTTMLIDTQERGRKGRVDLKRRQIESHSKRSDQAGFGGRVGTRQSARPRTLHCIFSLCPICLAIPTNSMPALSPAVSEAVQSCTSLRVLSSLHLLASRTTGSVFRLLRHREIQSRNRVNYLPLHIRNVRL